MKRKFKKKFQTLANRLLRMPRTRGFGVQSPTAYSFLRKVVNESCFLSSHLDASWMASYPTGANRRERLLHRLRCVYPQSSVVPVEEWACAEGADSLLSTSSNDTVLILLDLNRDKKSKLFWQRIIVDKRCVLTFDLQDCGIIFFDKTKFKQNFKVNY